MIINKKPYTPEKLFNIACRNAIQKDLIAVKQKYFNQNSMNGFVKCQETNILSKWMELAVDHRQPNTFSMIVERFKEINSIKVDRIEYKSNVENLILFQDEKLTQSFIKYHSEKANLRIVRKECNASRTALARVKRNSKDLFVEQKNQLSLF